MLCPELKECESADVGLISQRPPTMPEYLVIPAVDEGVATIQNDSIEFLQPSRCELSVNGGNDVPVYAPQKHDGRHANSDLCSEMSHDEIFKQFELLSRVMLRARGFAGRELKPYDGRKWSPSIGTPPRMSSGREAQDEGFLRGSNENAINSVSDVRERDGNSPMELSWRSFMNTSMVGGIEDWVERLHVPETPDGRMKLIYKSICAERKKRELFDQINESVLQTDSELRPIMVQVQINEVLDKIHLIKYSVETMEDVLIRLSVASLEREERGLLIEKLAATLHREAINELLRLVYARNLALVSIGVLLDSNFKFYAVATLKALLSDVVHEEINPRPGEKKLFLKKIIERGTKTESELLEREFLAFVNYFEITQWSGPGAEIKVESPWSIRAKSIIGELFANTRGSGCVRPTGVA